MLPFTKRLSVTHWLAVVTALTLLAAGCGGNTSPTSPNLPGPIGGATFGSQSASAISGQLVGGGGSAVAASFGATPVASAMGGVQVSIQGTGVSTTTDTGGHFLLTGVPHGNVVLQFSGGGANANLTLNGVGANTLIQIVIQLQSTTATVVEQSVNELGEFEGQVAAIDTSTLSFTLDDGTVIVTDAFTWWDTGGDFGDYAALAAAFGLGTPIRVEGRAVETSAGVWLATVVKAEADELDVEDLELALSRDKWSLGWIDNGSSGAGNSAIEAWISDGPFADIDPATVQLTGPDGSVAPFATELEADRFEARFTKAQVISVATSVAPGTTIEVTVSGMLLDGTPFELTAAVEIVDDDDDGGDDDGGNKIDAAVAAQAITDIQAVIDYINGLVTAGDMAANDAKPLVTKLESAIASLGKLNGNPAVNKLGAFLNELDASEKTGKIPGDDADVLEEMVEDIIDLIEGD